jgi:transcriptional antiterminator NusG
MDDKKNIKADEIEETVSDEAAALSNTASADVDTQPTDTNMPKAQEETPVENIESEKELEAPEKLEEIEAPKEELIEAKEEDGIPLSDPVDEATKGQVKESKTSTEDTSTPSAPSTSDKGKWYIVHTYSGHENKVSKSLHQRIESMGFENRIFEIIVPTRETVKVSQGKKETVKEKIFPGYVLVKMILDDESWLLVRTTQGVTAFIGAGNKPTPISDKEVEAIQKFMATEEPLYKTAFTIGEAVKIVDGPFSDFLGSINNIDEAKGKLKVLVSIFGRETPVELDFLQVSKL